MRVRGRRVPVTRDDDRSGERRRWFLLAVATVGQIGMAAIRLGVLALMPFIRQDLALDRTQIGFITTILNAGGAAAGIPAGKAVDRFGERLVIGYGAIGSGLVILAVSLTQNFAALLLILTATGLLTTAAAPAGGKIVTRWFRDSERATAMGIRQTGVPLGGAIAAVALPPIALLTSWQTALSVAGLCAIVIGVAALRLYREPADTTHYEGHGPRPSVAALLARPDIRAVMVYSFLFGAGQWSYLTYLTLYLTEEIKLSVILAGTLLGVAQLCGTAGRIGWGVVSDRFFRGHRKPALLLVGGLAVLMTLAMTLMSPHTPFVVIAGITGLLGLSLQGWNGLVHTFASELAGARVAGLAVGMANSIGFVGVMLLPPVFGAVVDWTGSYRAAWVMVTVLLLVPLGLLVYVKETNGGGSAP